MNTETAEAVQKINGMGAIVHDSGVYFRVWAPDVQIVYVMGEFNEWSKTKNKLKHEGNGFWGGNIDGAQAGQQYKFLLKTVYGDLEKNDPYAREVTNSNGNSIICDPHFEWSDQDFKTPSWNAMVIYEMHVGTFNVKQQNKPGDFYGVKEKLPYLKALGINAIEIMPPTEFPGGYSWGYNPSHPFALETDYGGVKAFKEFVNAAHAHGIAVILDIVYNHYGPSDLDLWRFNGWSENNGGGIYFYQDYRAETPWGNTRPDYGRPEVRQYIRDNAMMWLEEFHADGLRSDAIAFIRNVKGEDDPKLDLPDGWSLMKWINEEVKARFPWKITIAEDLRNNEWITKPEGEGGQGFGTQWDNEFVHTARAVLSVIEDKDRDMSHICNAIKKCYNGNAFNRVIYTESHDEVANGLARFPEQIAPSESNNWFAKKKSILGAVLTMTAPGIPMIFQGQEMLEGGWFEDTKAMDWSRFSDFKGIVKLYRDLIMLRRNSKDVTRGLSGQHNQIIHVNNEEKIVAFHRWEEGGPRDSVIIVLNFANKTHHDYNIGMPEAGLWKVRFNSDWKGYDKEFGDQFAYDTETYESHKDNQSYNANVNLGPYDALILSRD